MLPPPLRRASRAVLLALVVAACDGAQPSRGTDRQVDGSEPHSAPSASDATTPRGPSAAPAPTPPADASTIPTAPRYDAWPRITSALRRDSEQEARIAAMVEGMTLRQKVGQMTQAEAPDITPDDVRTHHIGSVLSGAGAWPVGRRGTASAWAALADVYWEASMATDLATPVPILFGIDAVHGNQKQFGATLFPHNIGLGAARDPDLTARIGEATAAQMRVSGVDYTFAPCVAVPRDVRWGRTYEGFSEDPSVVRALGAALTRGLMQANEGGTSFRGVVPTAKHFVGDGSTDEGVDQGISRVDEDTLRNVHAQGYFGALEAGAQTIMASYNSWVEPGAEAPTKIHGSRYLLTTVLKEQLGFDGAVISDYRGIGQVPGCSESRCAQAINAGIDLVMAADGWRQFIDDTVALVERGEIPLARIDDAVARILRVKLRAGLFTLPKPSARPGASETDRLLARELGREAVRKSAVLLKNEHGTLPLADDARVLVVGKSADSLPNQNGGWSRGGQSMPPSDPNDNGSFPGGTTVLAALRARLGDARVTFSERARDIDVTAFDAVVAVLGETPYAEYGGDIMWNPLRTWGPSGTAIAPEDAAMQTLEHAVRHPEDLAVLDTVAGRGVPVVTVFFSGRPLYTSRELNRSDAFVAAWLPGTEGQGLVDLLVRSGHDFRGRLPYSWPRHACQTSTRDAADDAPLFRLGYGLSSEDKVTVPTLDERAGPAAGCPRPAYVGSTR
ncbi:MAG: glycoside hydrolase family 3 protein [Polyangiales bacterium]